VGSLLDVIFLIVASSADERGVTGMLYSAIRSRARELKCARIRFWSQNSQNWSRMRDEAQFNRVDHGLMVYSNDQD
jgi:phosphoribosyl-AMP cyclohydrolase